MFVCTQEEIAKLEAGQPNVNAGRLAEFGVDDEPGHRSYGKVPKVMMLLQNAVCYFMIKIGWSCEYIHRALGEVYDYYAGLIGQEIVVKVLGFQTFELPTENAGEW